MRELLKLYNLGCCQITISNNLKKMGITRKRLPKKNILKELRQGSYINIYRVSLYTLTKQALTCILQRIMDVSCK